MIDKIYIICKKTHYNNKKLCEIQLDSNIENDYIFMDAIYPSETNYLMDAYKNIIRIMDPFFVKCNFSLGAFGCLLSHIECIKHAKNNNYENILVLEEDFVMCKDFNEKYNKLINNININNLKWDLIYLGKKQGLDDVYSKNNKVHLIEKYNKIKDVNKMFYVPNYQTWATHSLLIKNTMFNSIIEFEKNITAPYDLLLMSLYDKFSFLCAKNDLFITYEEKSDIRKIDNLIDPYKKWNWNIDSYRHFRKYNIKNFIIYDFLNSEHTHQYIHKMYNDFLKFYYPELNILWYNNFDEIPKTIQFEETIFFIAPCHKKISFSLPEQSFYIIHLDFINNNICNYDILIKYFFKDHQNLFEANKYIIITCRESPNINYFEENIKLKTICLPWFSNNLYSELNDIKKNLMNIHLTNSTKEYFCYFGSIWNININIICELIDICIKNNFKLLLKGRLFGVSGQLYRYIVTINSQHPNIIYEDYDRTKAPDDYKNSFEYIDDKYGIKYMLPLQGNDHNDKYISNRIFETLSLGYIVVTNCNIVKKYFTNAIYDNDILSLVNKYIYIMNNPNIWTEIMNQQIHEFLHKFYGYNNIKKIFDFVCKINANYDRFICYNHSNNIENNSFTIWIRNKNNINITEKEYYKFINNNDDLRKAICNCTNYILLYDENYDIFLMNRLFNMPVYNILIDSDVTIDPLLYNISNIKNDENISIEKFDLVRYIDVKPNI
jgi:GR25 family glycosyltransferase involved in LPS biosynthesis